MHYEDIPEHFNTYYKYSQFLFDGLIVEAEYMNFFEVYGTLLIEHNTSTKLQIL